MVSNLSTHRPQVGSLGAEENFSGGKPVLQLLQGGTKGRVPGAQGFGVVGPTLGKTAESGRDLSGSRDQLIDAEQSRWQPQRGWEPLV